MSTIPSDLVDIRDKLSNCADTWLKESDALLQSIAKGIMADRQEIVSLKHSLKKALEENKVLKAKLRFAETSTLYTADSLDTLDSSMPLITVGEVDSSEVQTGVEMMLLFKSLLRT
ncbi:hypothetical protein HDE_12792 [Halotydeus destructor]|nr:hypothetical protein HDE_12792 [Halotydeus destructor]